MHKLRVGVLMGGKSIEKEVSFNSGRTICDHLDISRYTVIPLFQTSSGDLFVLPWNFLHRGKVTDFEWRLEKEAEKITWDSLKKSVDFIYIAQHGRYAEDGCLQGMLEVLSIPYLGSKVAASALSMDKSFQKKILKAHGIDTPRGITLTPTEISIYKKNQEQLFDRLEKEQVVFPLLIKPVFEGSSLGITVAYNKQELIAGITAACTVYTQKEQAVILEEYITGTEFTAVIITDYSTGKLIPLPLTEIVKEAGTDIYTYEQKYMPGRATKYTPARISEQDTQQILDICMSAMKALGITNIIRIDGFLTKDKRIVIFDPNTLSGMGPASFIFRQAAESNMNHAQLINHLIETELSTYGMLEKVLLESKKREEMNQNKILRVGVLLGGRSNEKEISLESGRNVFYKLSSEKYKVTPLFVNSSLDLYALDNRLLVHNSTSEIEAGIKPEMHVPWSKLPELFDFIFIALHGGEGENGAIQGTLEMLGLPYNGSSILASSLCMDKYKTNNLLKTEGFIVPEHILLNKLSWQTDKKTALETISKNIGFPVIVKPHDDGCSVFVSRANNQEQLEKTLEEFFSTKKTHAFIEELIVGMELTVGVIGNENPQALPPSQAVSASGLLSLEEKFLPGAGENQTPAPLPKEALLLVQRTMEQVYKAAGCSGYARIDCFYQSATQSKTGKEQVVIIEINSLPALTPATCLFHQASEVGIKPMELIDKLIELGLEKHQISI